MKKKSARKSVAQVVVLGVALGTVGATVHHNPARAAELAQLLQLPQGVDAQVTTGPTTVLVR